MLTSGVLIQDEGVPWWGSLFSRRGGARCEHQHGHGTERCNLTEENDSLAGDLSIAAARAMTLHCLADGVNLPSRARDLLSSHPQPPHSERGRGSAVPGAGDKIACRHRRVDWGDTLESAVGTDGPHRDAGCSSW